MSHLRANGLTDAWRGEILPARTAHHHGDYVNREARYGLAALRRQTTSSVADRANGGDTANRVGSGGPVDAEPNAALGRDRSPRRAGRGRLA